MSSRSRENDGARVAALLLIGVSAAALAALPATVDNAALRVCADPDNAPFSREDRSGFENRIAELMGKALGVPVRYYWWPQRRGFLRNTLNAGVCDVVIGMPAGSEGVLTTAPYYRAGYVFVYRPDRIDALRSFDDPRLRTWRVGVPLVGNDLAATPPGNALARRGVTTNVIGYAPLGATPVAQRMMSALGDGTLDVALLWAPQAGWFAQQQNFPVGLAPAEDPKATEPQAFAMAMAVRAGDTALRDALDQALARVKPQVDAVLRDYAVTQTRSGDTVAARRAP